MTSVNACNDCGAAPGERHEQGCDVARCTATGGQWIQCPGEWHEHNGRGYGEHEGACQPDVWTGAWPGSAECIEFGWYAKFVPGRGWVRTTADDPDARPDLNRLGREARWDAEAQRFVRRAAS